VTLTSPSGGRDSRPRLAPHCRVLPRGALSCMIIESLRAYSERFVTIA